MFTLDNFEDEIDDIYLKRGLDYFRGGRISGLREIGNGRWRAKVKGNFDYIVEVILSGREIIESFCDCPCEGDFCKHQVAIFYQLAGDSEKLEQPDVLFLTKMTKEELLALIKSAQFQVPEFDEFIISESRLANKSGDKKSLKTIVRDSVNYAKDRHGFIDYWQAHKAVKGAEKVLTLGESFEKIKPLNAIDAFGAIIEILVPALQSSDDSDGAIGEYIEHAFLGLKRIAEDNKSLEIKNYLFDYCLAEYKNKRYNGWHFALEFLEIATLLAAEKDKKRLFNELDNYLIQQEKSEEEYDIGYEMEKTALLKLYFIDKHEGENAAEKFIVNNLPLNDIREEAVKRAIAKKEFEKAKALAKEGIKINENRYPGLVHGYLESLLTIAQIENDCDSQIKLLIKLFLSRPSHDFTYFEKLKSLVNKSDWTKILEKIEKEIGSSYDLAKIYSLEKDWQRVLAVIQKSNSHYLVDEYFKELSNLYPKELSEIYERFVFDGIDYAGGRGDYAQRAIFLKNISSLGFKERACEIGQELKEKYKNRRAMIEEFLEAGF